MLVKCSTVVWCAFAIFIGPASVNSGDNSYFFDYKSSIFKRGVLDSGVQCYNETGAAQRCLPAFENAAFGKLVEATNTCGENGPTEFCTQTTQNQRKSCQYCQQGDYPAYHLTDLNSNTNQTWWQSETMYENIQYPNQVNLTLNLGKAYDITYVRLMFHTQRPESFVIFKRLKEDGPWIPFQYYSATCRDTYGLPVSDYARRNEEAKALCTAEYSDISPLTGGNVPFSTLEGRPSSGVFDSSPELHEWVTATDIRIMLHRLNTFGDEVFKDEQVLKSYFYAISDFAVGARCKCNGHASECVPSVSFDGKERLTCKCQHHTAGPDCNECLPFYNDAPWKRASESNANECKPCNCNGYSNRCFFDKELYEKTGHGGHCLDCTGNRDGPNCERCRDNYYQRNNSLCVPCQCNEIGSRNLQCNSEGKCQCKPGVTDVKCDQCEVNFYDFGPSGCKECNCYVPGSYRNEPDCDQNDGTCRCKENVEGKTCRTCKPGFFNMDKDNEFGCTPCFCYGHSSICHSAPGYSKVSIESMFGRHNERWTAEDSQRRNLSLQYMSATQVISVNSPDYAADDAYFVAPDRFLGDQRASYNQDLEFKLRIGKNVPAATIADIILEGGGKTISQTIFGQGNQLPSTAIQTYKFRLHENREYQWQPRLAARDFISLLSNLTAIKIRGTYHPQGQGFLDDVKLNSARRGASGPPVSWIEMCSCPPGYVGQFCESCAPGSRHDPPSGGRFSPCVPCNCNSHADICDPSTGRCICQHNTAGDNCDKCAKGYYGNALQGTSEDCTPCPCPNQGSCMQLPDETIVCLECPKGYSGHRCDICGDGYFGDPTGSVGDVRLCAPCDCNNNIDPNAVGICNRTSGECLKCIYNTGGPQCDQCLPGFFGDALAMPKGDCKPCQCSSSGTEETLEGPPICDQLTGQCTCKPHVIGTICDACEPGYYNLESGKGCQACNCDQIGSKNHTCDVITGQCSCQPGVTGLRCQVCQAFYYGFSDEGCKPCNCDRSGSVAEQCDPTGQCPCLENVEGKRCDRCKENKFNTQQGCIDCPSCYNLVQDAVKIHRKNLKNLISILDDIAANPTVINDQEFEIKLKDVMDKVEQLYNDAKKATNGGDQSLLDEINELHGKLDDVNIISGQIRNWTLEALKETNDAKNNVTNAEDIIDRARTAVQGAIDYMQTDGFNSLATAIERSNQFGQQSKRMSDIAREARTLAENYKNEADKIKDTAIKALNISTEAYELAKKAISEQKNISDELREVAGPDLNNLKSKFQKTKENAVDVQGHVTNVYNDALALYTDIHALNIPNEIDTNKMKNDAQDITAEAAQVEEKVKQLLDNYDGVLSDVDEQIVQVKDLLQRADDQMKITDELLADADEADAVAEEAVNLGNKTMQEAQQTLRTLVEFDTQVKESKEKAEKSLESMPEILVLIKEAEKKTTNAEEALADAESNAKIARDFAQDAQKKYAEQASKEADEIRRQAEETKEAADKLRDEADELASQVAVTASKVTGLEAKAAEGSDNTNQAKEKVGQAKSTAADTKVRVEEALNNVNNILKDLGDLIDIDEESLNKLEKQLEQAEYDLEQAQLDEKLKHLNEAKINQTLLIRSYEEELKTLKGEVANLEDISSSLPNSCYKQSNIENY